jgi:hypothetical protein
MCPITTGEKTLASIEAPAIIVNIAVYSIETGQHSLLHSLWGERKFLTLRMSVSESRYWCAICKEKGVTRIVTNKSAEATSVDILAVVEPGWQIIWKEGHDMGTMRFRVADERGIHTHNLDGGFESLPWAGQRPLSEADLIELFKTSRID